MNSMTNIAHFTSRTPMLDTSDVYRDCASIEDTKHRINTHGFVQIVEYTEIDETTHIQYQ